MIKIQIVDRDESDEFVSKLPVLKEKGRVNRIEDFRRSKILLENVNESQYSNNEELQFTKEVQELVNENFNQGNGHNSLNELFGGALENIKKNVKNKFVRKLLLKLIEAFMEIIKLRSKNSVGNGLKRYGKLYTKVGLIRVKIYEGELLNGLKHGKGTKYKYSKSRMKNEKIYDGFWKHDVLVKREIFILGHYMQNKKINSKKIKLGKQIHRHVYEAVVHNVRKVCAKLFKMSREFNLNELHNEVRILLESHHPNIIKCYGWSKQRRLLLMELCTCSLGDILSNRYQHNLNYSEKIRIAWEIAKGLTYLHRIGYVHRDIKTDNILIKFGNCLPEIKIGDFGTAASIKELESQKVGQVRVGTEYYIAPEIKNKSGKHSTKCDVYSFGVLIFKMFFAPDQNQMDTFHNSICDENKEVEMPDNGADNEIIRQWLKTLIKNCCDLNPSVRMDMNNISSVLERVVESNAQLSEKEK